MFEVTKKEARFSNYNPRTELHGDTRSPATDISLAMMLPNTILDELCPGLRAALYEAPKNPDLVEATDPDALTALRFPLLELPLKLGIELLDRTLVIDYGLGDELSNITLPECKVHKFSIEPQNGGSVLVKFQVTAHPDEKQSGFLYLNQQTDIVISLEAPEQPQGDIFAPAPAKKSKKELAAEAKAAAEKLFEPEENPLAGTEFADGVEA